VAMEEAAWSGIAMVALGCHGCPAEAGLWPLCCFHTPPSNPSVGLAFRAMISEPGAKSTLLDRSWQPDAEPASFSPCILQQRRRHFESRETSERSSCPPVFSRLSSSRVNIKLPLFLLPHRSRGNWSCVLNSPLGPGRGPLYNCRRITPAVLCSVYAGSCSSWVMTDHRGPWQRSLVDNRNDVPTPCPPSRLPPSLLASFPKPE
jgi:hypothetical protein